MATPPLGPLPRCTCTHGWASGPDSQCPLHAGLWPPIAPVVFATGKPYVLPPEKIRAR